MKKSILITVILLISNLNAQDYLPGEHELFFMPTAITMPAGSAYFADYEVILLNFTMAPTNSTHLGLYTLFPLTTEFLESVTFSVKQQLYRSEKFGTALFGLIMPKGGVYLAGNVFSYGTFEKSVHAAVGIVGNFEIDKPEVLLMVGGKINVSEKVALIGEYSGTTSMLDSDYPGIVSIGVRFRTSSTSWELAGMRPLGDVDSDILLWPFLKAVFYF